MENRFNEDGKIVRKKINYLGIDEDELTREELLWALAEAAELISKQSKEYWSHRAEGMSEFIKNR